MYVVRYLINWTLKVEAKPENGRPKDDKKIPNASEKVVEKVRSTEILFSISLAARSRFLFIEYIKLYFFASLHGSLESSANKSIRKNVFFKLRQALHMYKVKYTLYLDSSYNLGFTVTANTYIRS